MYAHMYVSVSEVDYQDSDPRKVWQHEETSLDGAGSQNSGQTSYRGHLQHNANAFEDTNAIFVARL
jgi:hypothetical protein